MANETQIKVPDIGDFDAVEVIELLVAPGDQVAVEDGILTLETDKASMDVPTTVAGEVVSVSVAVGDKIGQGDVIAVIREAEGADVAPVDAAPGAAATEAADTTAPVSPKPEAPATASETLTMGVPDIGDFDAVDVIEIAVAVGDSVDIDDSLVTLETDKASMDIPSTHAGKITKLLVAVGDSVNKDTPLVEILTSGQAPSSDAKTPPVEAPSSVPTTQPPPAAKAAPVAAPAPDNSPPSPSKGALPAIDEAGFSKAHASPSVRRLARELGVNLVQVKGSAVKGRITADDVKAWVKARLAGGVTATGSAAALPATPKVDFSKFGAVTEVPLTRIQKISGPRLQASWINLPHVTQHDVADITDMEARRKALKAKAVERGIKLTPLAFVVRAVVQALAEYPRLNASLSADGESLVNKHYCHIGFAADTEDGLVVPVIKDADKMDIYELAKELADLSAAARDGKLGIKQMQGATFTISSLGGIGGTAFTPIVNAPEVAILGVSRSTIQPVWDGEQFMPRLQLPLSLSYDHRVVDGALAVRFTTYLGQCLSNVDGLLQAIP